jgi:antitoxin component of MazEF toxin-antitoxin module
MATPVKVKKWGNNIVIVIPSQFAKKRHIYVGTMIDIELVKVIKRRRRYKIEELLAQFEPKHRHREWNFGQPVGKEL